MLQAPPLTPYDLRFHVWRFPVRISVWFWLGTFLLGYQAAGAWDRGLEDASPGMLPIVMIWIGCVFVSIMIHELGHTLAYRRYHIDSSIVLYHMGGLAIPGGESEVANDFAYDPSQSYARSLNPDAWRSGSSHRTKGTLTPQQHIIVSLAGPFLQIASALGLIVFVKLLGYGMNLEVMEGSVRMDVGPLHWLPNSIGKQLFIGKNFSNAGLFLWTDFYLFVSLYWALLNLVPVWPLDGGQVTEKMVELKRAPSALTFQISLAASICLVIYALSKQQTFMAILFAYFAFNSYQRLRPTSRGHY